MAKTEWTKEYPSLKYGSWFWLRDAPDAEPELRQLTGGRNWMEAFGAVRDSTEFLGPVTAADFEQLTRLREAAEVAEQRLADNERWWRQEKIKAELPDSYKQAFEARTKVTREALDRVREALAQRNTGGK